MVGLSEMLYISQNVENFFCISSLKDFMSSYTFRGSCIQNDETCIELKVIKYV